MEINYYLTSDQPWRNDPDLLVLANGDAVGSTVSTLTSVIGNCSPAQYHADFHNGVSFVDLPGVRTDNYQVGT